MEAVLVEAHRLNDHARARSLSDGDHDAALGAQLARLESTIAALESFNASVSHDLRGPLGSIQSLALIAGEALDSNDPTLARRMLELIAGQADRCTQLVCTLMTLARTEGATLNRSWTDLDALVCDVIAQLCLDCPQAHAVNFELHALSHVWADASLLRPALVNLVANAVKFTRERRPPRITISAVHHAAQTIVQVKDNGVGFDPQTAHRLFQPFVRLHARQYEGHGVGLSIARAAIERHGGRIWATAERGAGACFSFSLPDPA